MFALRLWRRGGAVFLACLLIFTICGCGNSGDGALPEEVSTQGEEIQTEAAMTDYTADDVELPEDFGLMAYPVEAVAVEYYTQGLPYYKDGDDVTSFWFSMAVLSSMLEKDGILEPTLYQDYCYYHKEEISEFASALYSRYASGEMELPEVIENDPYVLYDETSKQYGLLNGNVGDLGIIITGCEPSRSGWQLETQLINLESNDVLSEFSVELVARADKKGKEVFPYSIRDMQELTLSSAQDAGDTGTAMEKDKADGKDKDKGNKDQKSDKDRNAKAVENSDKKNASSAGTSVAGGLPSTAEAVNDSLPAEETEPDAGTETGNTDSMISRQEAASLAESFLGDGFICSFRQMISMYDMEYYDFSVKGEEAGVTDVLVSTDGSDVVTGTQNEDGSWTIDP